MTTDALVDFSPAEHILRSEMAVAGAAMESARAAEALGDILRPEHFRRPAHGLIFGAALALAESGAPVDPVAVMGALTRAGDLMRAGGGQYLHDCLAAAAVPDVSWHAREVLADWQRRHVGERLVTALDYVRSPGFDPGTGLERVRAMIDTATAPARLDGVQPLDDLLDEVLTSLEHEAARGIATPWTDLNKLIGGLAPSELILLAARAGVGKSIGCLGIARHAALKFGLPVLFASMEMTRQEIMLRMISAEGGVPLTALVQRHLTDLHWDQIARARERIMGSPLVIDDTPACSLAHLRSRLRGMARTAPAALLVVDYLQLLTEPARSENRQAAVAGLSRGLKLLAGEFAIPVVAAAQLNRQPEHRSDRRPQASDLRESGALEADASVVVLLHRPDMYDPESERVGEIDFIVDKNRSGPRKTVSLLFQGDFARCVDPAWTASGKHVTGEAA